MPWKKRYSTKDHARSGQTKKFGNKKIEFESISFDSKLEVELYKEFKDSKLLKEVIAHPPKLVLYESDSFLLSDGKKYLYREVCYNPDFLIIDQQDNKYYIDVKSFPTITPDFILKFKMCYQELGVYIHIITKQSWHGEETVKKIIDGSYYSALSKKKLESL